MHVVTTHECTPGPVRSMAQESICRNEKPYCFYSDQIRLRFYQQGRNGRTKRIENVEGPERNGQVRKMLLPRWRQKHRRGCHLGQVRRGKFKLSILGWNSHDYRQKHGYTRNIRHLRMGCLPAENYQGTTRRITLATMADEIPPARFEKGGGLQTEHRLTPINTYARQHLLFQAGSNLKPLQFRARAKISPHFPSADRNIPLGVGARRAVPLLVVCRRALPDGRIGARKKWEVIFTRTLRR